MKKIIVIAIVLFFICLQSAYPQITTNELPVSIQRGLGVFTKDKATGTISLPIPDIKKVLLEDSLDHEKNPNGLKRTAVSIPVDININKDGIWSSLEDGGRLWQMEIHAEKALALDFVFSEFWLPKSGKFYLFNPSTQETIGAITAQYLYGETTLLHRLSTGIIKGDKIILEYYQPAEEKELPVIKADKAYYTYIPTPNFLSPYTCSYEVNVNCSEGDNWQYEKNAVAMVYCKYDNFAAWCSGSLVNNTQNDMALLFLTANHCLWTKDANGDNDLSDWIFYWGYELENCSSTTQPDYYNKTTVGATLIANNSYSDFALLQLQQNPINIIGYIPYFLGWDASGNSGTGGVCIHHPNHDVKKISTYSGTPQTISYNSANVYWGVQWIQTVNGHGITEEGSSGAPLINNSHKVIGQLTGTTGSLDCSDLTGGSSGYGKLSASWSGNGNSDYRRRLNYWLDPTGTGFTTNKGLFPLSISGPVAPCNSDVYSVTNLPSGYAVNWSWHPALNPLSNLGGMNYIQPESHDLNPLIPPLIDYVTLLINVPSTNQCTIVIPNGTYALGTLKATIKKNGTTICVLEKNLDSTSGFYGTYTRTHVGAPTVGPYQFSSGSTIMANYGDVVTLQSPYFINANISKTSSIPLNWTNNNGTIYFVIPMNSQGGNDTATISFSGTNEDYCMGFYFTIYVNATDQLMAPTSDYDLQIESKGQNYLFSMVHKGNCKSDVMLNHSVISWKLTIVNTNTGQIVYNGETNSSTLTINTESWKDGIYAARAVIGDDVITKKISYAK